MSRGFFRSCAVLIALLPGALLIPVLTRAQDSRERTLFVSVVDKDGAPVSNLGVSDFIVREDRAPREVLRVSPAVEPIDIAVLIDTSSAMDSAITFMREGLTRFVTAMLSASQIANQRGNHIALVGLADRPTILTDYTNSLAQLKAGIGKVFPHPNSGMTLLDALVETSRGLERREAERTAIVAVLTDGPEVGNYDDRTAINALKKAGTSFHAVTVGRFEETDPVELRYRLIALAEGTRQTGGRHDSLLVASGVPHALDKLGRQLSSQYKVVYSRPESLIPPESIEVSVARPGLTARGTPGRGQRGQR